MVPGGAVSLQPLLAPAVSSVQPHSSVGPAKAGALLGIWMGGALQPCGKSDNLRGGWALDRAAGSLVCPMLVRT